MPAPASTAITSLYERHARDFDRDRSRSLQERAWLDRFLGHVRPSGTVLDVGCGMAPLMFTSGPSEGEAIGCYCDEPLYHASLDPEAYEQLLAASGFSVRAYLPDDPECGRHTVWLATYDQPAPS